MGVLIEEARALRPLSPRAARAESRSIRRRPRAAFYAIIAPMEPMVQCEDVHKTLRTGDGEVTPNEVFILIKWPSQALALRKTGCYNLRAREALWTERKRFGM